MRAALRMREAMERLSAETGREDLLLKIGLHEGPCLAVTLNDRQDYFGQTVNIAARVQGSATSRLILATASVVDDEKVGAVLAAAELTPTGRQSTLRGIANEFLLFEIP
jgi:class 3 adenylate cyclase